MIDKIIKKFIEDINEIRDSIDLEELNELCYHVEMKWKRQLEEKYKYRQTKIVKENSVQGIDKDKLFEDIDNANGELLISDVCNRILSIIDDLKKGKYDVKENSTKKESTVYLLDKLLERLILIYNRYPLVELDNLIDEVKIGKFFVKENFNEDPKKQIQDIIDKYGSTMVWKVYCKNIKVHEIEDFDMKEKEQENLHEDILIEIINTVNDLELDLEGKIKHNELMNYLIGLKEKEVEEQ